MKNTNNEELGSFLLIHIRASLCSLRLIIIRNHNIITLPFQQQRVLSSIPKSQILFSENPSCYCLRFRQFKLFPTVNFSGVQKKVSLCAETQQRNQLYCNYLLLNVHSYNCQYNCLFPLYIFSQLNIWIMVNFAR